MSHIDNPVSPQIVIVGAGCVGLSCGVQLLQAGMGPVVVVTKQTTPHTTSDQAGQRTTHINIYTNEHMFHHFLPCYMQYQCYFVD